MNTSAYEAPRAVIAIAFAAAVAALAGGYWDDAWHTTRGRDTFLAAPHIAIYAGIAIAGGALATWAALVVRSEKRVRALLEHRPLALALLAIAVTLASGPIDNAWHEAFGRDAVIWSPPHMLGIAGTLALGAALLAEVARRRRGSAWLAAVAGALVLSSAAFSVVEYDTDVPQFDVLWYVPVLALAAAIAFTLVRQASDRPHAATEAALVHLGFVAAVAAFLGAVSLPAPAVPLLVAPALALDFAARRCWPPVAQAAAFAFVLYLTYVPVRNWLGDGVLIDAGDVAAGLPIAFAAVWAVLTVGSRGLPLPGRRAASAAAAALLLIGLSGPQPARAHDPGQGRDAGRLALTVKARDRAIALAGRAGRAECRGLTARGMVARRGGRTVRAPLVLRGCRFDGRLAVPERGRWFVYAELRRDGREIESWLPIEAGDGVRRSGDASRYAYEPRDSPAGAGQVIAGALLYAGMAGLLVAVLALVRPAPAGAARRSAGISGTTRPNGCDQSPGRRAASAR
jgi:hypothetical protein